MAELTPKQRKTFAKITEALQEFPFGATIQDLYNEARLSMTVIKNALEKMNNVEQRGDSWFLKTTDGSRAGEAVEPTVEQPVMQDSAENLQDNTENMQEDIGNIQDTPVNMQDEELNTQAHQVSSPVSDVAPHISLVDNEPGLVDNHDSLVDINTDIDLDWSIAPKWANYRTVDKDNLAKWHENKPVLGATIWSSIGLTESTGYIKGLINWQTSLRQRPQSDNADDHLHPDFAALPDHQSSNGQVIETASVAENEEEFELQPPPIATKHYVLIENCTLSLAQDGTGQEPVLAKDIWVDDEGEELEESDCQVMRRAREPLSNWVDFRGVTYRNLLIVNNAQIFHGVFDSIKTAHDKMAELTTKKRGNFFEVIEV